MDNNTPVQTCGAVKDNKEGGREGGREGRLGGVKCVTEVKALKVNNEK